MINHKNSQFVRSTTSLELKNQTVHILNQEEHKNSRPKLVKQKQSITDDEIVLKELVSQRKKQESRIFRKQSSLNEELMAENRIREKEKIRKKIQKQISLNETFLCRSLLLSKKLQIIKEGLTSTIKTSTDSLEKVKTNIVRNYFNSDIHKDKCEKKLKIKKEIVDDRNVDIKFINYPNKSYGALRRESGSDSSKDSSLQSDESEDSSFASVIFIPNNNCEFTGTENLKAIASKNQEKNINETLKTKTEAMSYLAHANSINTIHSTLAGKNIKSESLGNKLNEVSLSKHQNVSKFPIVKRPTTTNVINNFSRKYVMPKLTCLDLFNPEIDDIDSESSGEDSSDSLESVISTSQNFLNGLELFGQPSRTEKCHTEISQKVLKQFQQQKLNDLILEENEDEEEFDKSKRQVNVT